jgi:hypothetical protein
MKDSAPVLMRPGDKRVRYGNAHLIDRQLKPLPRSIEPAGPMDTGPILLIGNWS